jgi:hypothetical protein
MDLTPDDLPRPDAGLGDFIRFSAAHNPTPDFRARWGADYAARAMDLWGELLLAFRHGAPPPFRAPDELLMGLAYDIAAGPYVQVPAGQSASFQRWLVQGVRQSLMTVIDYQPAGWFLVGDGTRLMLNVNCSHGAASYSFLMALNEDEVRAYAAQGRAFINTLADDVQYTAPGVACSTSPYGARDLSGPDRERADAVIAA